MASLHAPLPTLRRNPRGGRRTARGRCGCRGRDGSYLPPPAQIPACGFCFAAPSVSRTGLLSKVRRDRHSGLGRPIQFRSVGSGRREHADSGSVSGACVGPCPSFNRPPSLHTRRHQPVDWRCSRLHRYYAAVRLLMPSPAASSIGLPVVARDRRGDCGRHEVSQVPTRSLTARTGLRLRRSDGPSHNGPAHIACGGLQRLGLHGKSLSRLNTVLVVSLCTLRDHRHR